VAGGLMMGKIKWKSEKETKPIKSDKDRIVELEKEVEQLKKLIAK
jgi:hypothetical protein